MVKVPEDHLEIPSSQWKQSPSPNTGPKSSPKLAQKYDPKQFIERIERRAMSAHKGIKTTMKGHSLSIEAKPRYKTLLLNWGQELEKHDKILQKFHIFAPLKYDIDATFHKLFSSKSKELIKQKLKFKKKNKLMKAGYLENEIDLMFASNNLQEEKQFG